MTSQKPSSFIVELESVRGIAASWVVLGHCFGALILPPPYPYAGGVPDWLASILLTIADPVPAVYIFFVLSGLVLSFQLSSMRLGLVAYGAYVARRLVRLMLPVWVSVAFAALAWYLVGNPRNLHDLLRSFILLDFRINDPLWSLQVEIVVSAIMPLLVSFVVRSTNPIRIFALLLIWYLYMHGVGQAHTMHLLFFYIGILLPYASLMLRSMNGFDWQIAMVAGFVCLLSGHAFFPAGEIYSQVIGPTLLVLFAYTNRGLASTALLRRPAARFLGRASYPMYLIHYPILKYAMWVSDSVAVHRFRMEHAIAYSTVLFILVFAATLVLAAAMVVLVERPSIRLSRFVGRAILGEAGSGGRLVAET